MTALDALLRPRSVAVVGASEQLHKVGGRPLHYLRTQGYAGRLYAVNPRAAQVQGLAAHASLADLPEAPEAVVLCVPADQVEPELRRCGERGVRQVVLFASGYAEVGGDGPARQERLRQLSRDAGMRLLGPNSIGSASFATGTVLSFASIYADHAPRDGAVAIVSQSGAFGVAAYALLRTAGQGVRYVVATGNEADLDTADVIAEVAGDVAVRVVLVYLESVPDPDRLRAALRQAAARGVAVVAVRAGRSEHGRRSAHWHTGSAGGGGDALDALFAEAGCRTVSDLAEWVASVPLYLAEAPRRDGPPRVALISNSGASCVLSADAAEVLGVPLARLSDETRARLDACLPAFSLNRNPIDLTAMLLAEPGLLGRVVDDVLADPGVDAASLGLLAIGGPNYDVPRFARDCADAVRRSAKPLAVHSPHPHVLTAFAAAGLAVYPGEWQAVDALRAHALHRCRLAAPVPLPTPTETIP